MTKPKIVRNLVIVSDTHAGCRLALYNPHEKVRVDDGGWYHPSEAQAQLWAYWRHFWDVWVPEVTRGEPYDLVHNGDATEGVHHQSVTQISHNTKDQKRIALAILKPEVDRCQKQGGTYYHIRGTEAHVGKSATSEEDVAEELGARPNRQGQFARWDLWKRVGTKEGPLVNLLHHIGTSGSAAHETSAVNAEYAAILSECARSGAEPPDFVVRGHRHRYCAVGFTSSRGPAHAFVVPGWQLKTPFAWKIAGARISEPQFGGAVIRQGDSFFYHREKVWRIGRSTTE